MVERALLGAIVAALITALARRLQAKRPHRRIEPHGNAGILATAEFELI